MMIAKNTFIPLGGHEGKMKALINVITTIKLVKTPTIRFKTLSVGRLLSPKRGLSAGSSYAERITLLDIMYLHSYR